MLNKKILVLTRIFLSCLEGNHSFFNKLLNTFKFLF